MSSTFGGDLRLVWDNGFVITWLASALLMYKCWCKSVWSYTLHPKISAFRWLLEIIFDYSFYSRILHKYYLFFMTYYSTEDILIINYLFIIYVNFLNKTNSQTWCLMVKKIYLFWDGGCTFYSHRRWSPGDRAWRRRCTAAAAGGGRRRRTWITSRRRACGLPVLWSCPWPKPAAM